MQVLKKRRMELHFLKLFMVVCFLISVSMHVGTCEGSQDLDQKIISWDDFTAEWRPGNLDADEGASGRVISVSKDGTGDSITVQGAVDMVPDGNSERVKILIASGVYREKVIVPITKPFISFIGIGSSETVISWNLKASDKYSDGQTVGTFDSASVAIESDYFCANGITFENTAPPAVPGAEGMQAVALRLSGDKAVIYRCKVLGSQDTLFDHIGRHYFSECYIQGSIDFIFGSARSLYQGCTLHSNAVTYGAIAASQRKSDVDNSGFSFLQCTVNGSGMLYLGRAWGRYARVIYSYCQFEGIIIPEGWNDWGDPSRRSTVSFGEFNCKGEGANVSKRVPWARSLTYSEVRPFLDQRYIDGHQWLRL